MFRLQAGGLVIPQDPRGDLLIPLEVGPLEVADLAERFPDLVLTVNRAATFGG